MNPRNAALEFCLLLTYYPLLRIEKKRGSSASTPLPLGWSFSPVIKIITSFSSGMDRSPAGAEILCGYGIIAFNHQIKISG